MDNTNYEERPGNEKNGGGCPGGVPAGAAGAHVATVAQDAEGWWRWACSCGMASDNGLASRSLVDGRAKHHVTVWSKRDSTMRGATERLHRAALARAEHLVAGIYDSAVALELDDAAVNYLNVTRSHRA